MKNTAFGATLSCSDEKKLRQLRIRVTLVYAPDSSKVEFDALKKEPVEWQTDVSGSSVSLQVRIKLLSSQVQNSLFRLQVSATEADDGAAVFEGESEPIKVVSKPDQIRKKRAAVGEPEVELPSSKRRARGEEILEQITSARDTQEKNLELLQKVIDGNATPQLSSLLASVASALLAVPASRRTKALRTALDELAVNSRDALVSFLLPALQPLKQEDSLEDEAGEEDDDDDDE